MKYTPVGVDIAKHLIQVHFINEHSGEVVDKQLRRQNFLLFFSNREPCLIGMEACGGSQHWARELTKLGHKVRLMQARFVKAFLMGNKNDVMDARAIWMALQLPGKAITVKTEEQQSVLVLHRSRQQLVKFRTAQINALHGTLLEFSETIHKGRAEMDRELPAALERMMTRLPPYLISVLEDQYNRLSELDSLIDGLEKQLISVAWQSDTCKRLMDIPGVGPLIATAAVATMGEASAFKSGREFAAYIGLVPKQTGSGGKVRLLGISKRGDTYLRTLFVHGARAASLVAKETLFTGTIDSTTVHPRELVKSAMKHNAASAVLAHNHPSQLAEPSQADRQITDRLVNALGLVDVRVLDHLVVGGLDIVSFAERGWLPG